MTISLYALGAEIDEILYEARCEKSLIMVIIVISKALVMCWNWNRWQRLHKIGVRWLGALNILPSYMPCILKPQFACPLWNQNLSFTLWSSTSQKEIGRAKSATRSPKREDSPELCFKGHQNQEVWDVYISIIDTDDRQIQRGGGQNEIKMNMRASLEVNKILQL